MPLPIATLVDLDRYALTAAPKILHGPQSLLGSISASIVPLFIETSESTSPLSGQRTWIVGSRENFWSSSETNSYTCIEWQWDQLRIMKVGGNESATKYFQSHGGSAVLASKDAKTRYTSGVASKYKDELKKRAAADARESIYPHLPW